MKMKALASAVDDNKTIIIESAIIGVTADDVDENNEDDDGGGDRVGSVEKSNDIQNLLNEHNGNPIERPIRCCRFPGISEILPSLYLCGAGVAIPCFLEQLEISCVINAAPELPDTPLPDSKPLYFKVPVLDRGEVDLQKYFDEVSDLIEQVKQSEGNSLVHCVAGVSRSASLCIAYLIKYCGMTLKEAFLHVKSKRSQIRPNIGFFRQLITYEQNLLGKTTVTMIFKESLGQEIPDVYEPEYHAMDIFYQKYRHNKKR